jgi:hypothetical protein
MIFSYKAISSAMFKSISLVLLVFGTIATFIYRNLALQLLIPIFAFLKSNILIFTLLFGALTAALVPATIPTLISGLFLYINPACLKPGSDASPLLLGVSLASL